MHMLHYRLIPIVKIRQLHVIDALVCLISKMVGIIIGKMSWQCVPHP